MSGSESPSTFRSFYRIVLVGCLCALLPAQALAAKVELPSWGQGAKPENVALGGQLFPPGAAPRFDQPPASEEEENEVIAQETQETATSEADQPQETPEETAEAPLPKRALLPRIPAINPLPVSEEQIGETPLPPIEGVLREEFFAVRPVDYLVDPQHLLTEQKKNDLARFLEYHADEARYHIYVIVLGETQELPADIDLKELQREWFQGEEAVLVAYHLGKPETTITTFGSEATNLLPQSIFDRVQQYCVAEAQIAADNADQIERFMIELSTRLWWVAKLIERQVIRGTALSSADAEIEMNRPSWETASYAEPIVLPSFESDEPATAAREETSAEFDLVTWLLAALVLLLVGLGSGIAAWLWRRDSLTSQPVLFPDKDLPTRLGGQFSGGGYVGISFAMEGEE